MNVKKLNLYMSILKFGLVAIGVILCLFLFSGPNMESTVEEQIAFRDGSSMSLAASFTGFIIFTSLGLILVFFIVQLITNPKKTILSIIGIVVGLLLYLIFTMIGTSDTNETLTLAENVQVDQGTIVSTSAGLYTVLVGISVGILAVLVGPLMGRYRK